MTDPEGKPIFDLSSAKPIFGDYSLSPMVAPAGAMPGFFREPEPVATEPSEVRWAKYVDDPLCSWHRVVHGSKYVSPFRLGTGAPPHDACPECRDGSFCPFVDLLLRTGGKREPPSVEMAR